MTIDIRPATAADRPEIERLLTANALPLEGLDLAASSTIVALDGTRLVGCAAVEVYGRDGLLRSVCVAADYRGLGLGERLVLAAENLSRELGIEDLYLLTETAATWFPRLGFGPADRSKAPERIAHSPEYASVCPVSSAFMRKSLVARAEVGS